MSGKIQEFGYWRPGGKTGVVMAESHYDAARLVGQNIVGPSKDIKPLYCGGCWPMFAEYVVPFVGTVKIYWGQK